MKFIVAVSLAIVSVVTAEPPAFQSRRFRQTSQDNAPYQPSGWRPKGTQFNLPLRQAPPSFYNNTPVQEYGPPGTDSPTTTTELISSSTEPTTDNSNIEILSQNIALPPTKKEEKSAKLDNVPVQNPVYVFVPQNSQNLVYSLPAKLISPVAQGQPQKIVQTQGVKPAPIQAVPAFAKIQYPPSVAIEQYPQFEKVVQFQNLQAYPVGYVSQNTILTPYSTSFVQIYQ